MKVSVRQDRVTIDMPSIGLVIAALETASEAWLDFASLKNEPHQVGERKALLKMAGEAKALAILVEAKQEMPDDQPQLPV